MPVSNPVDIGSAKPTGTSSTLALTTTATVSAGGKILIALAWNSGSAGVTVTSVTATGCSGAISVQINDFGAALMSNGLAYLDAPSGLASGSTITVNYSAASADNRRIGASYVTSAGVGAGYGPVSTSGAGSTWAAPSVTTLNGDIMHSSTWQVGSGSPGDGWNTATGGNTELHDIGIATSDAFADEYQIGSGASIIGQGTGSFSPSLGWLATAVGYSGPPPVLPPVRPIAMWP